MYRNVTQFLEIDKPNKQNKKQATKRVKREDVDALGPSQKISCMFS